MLSLFFVSESVVRMTMNGVEDFFQVRDGGIGHPGFG